MSFFVILMLVYSYSFKGDSMFNYEEKQLTVTNYKRLLILNDKEVIFDMPGYQLVISGIDLFVSFYEKLEVHIQGIISRLELKPC